MKPKRIAAIVAKLAQQKNAKEGTLAALKQGDVSEGKVSHLPPPPHPIPPHPIPSHFELISPSIQHALLVITGLVPTDNTPQ